MCTSLRLDPLRRLLATRLRPLDTEPWPGRLPADPMAAWTGRIRLDRARVESRPEDAAGWWRLGVGLHALGRHADASAAFLRALRRDTTDAPAPQILLITRDAPSLDRCAEVVAAAATTSDVELLWVCTAPVIFDAALHHADALDARVYCIDAGYLDAQLRSDTLPSVRAVLAHDASTVAALPRRIERVRVPRALCEGTIDDAAGFDRLLCPSPLSAHAWASPATTPVVWPHRPTAIGGTPSLVIDAFLDAQHPAAFDDATLHDVLVRLATETVDRAIVLSPSPERRKQALAVWKQWNATAVPVSRARVRVDLGNRRAHAASAATVVITEAAPQAWIRHVRGRAGLVVFDPRDIGGQFVTPHRVDSSLRVVECIHAHARRPEALARARNAARRAVLFEPPTLQLVGWFESFARATSARATS